MSVPSNLVPLPITGLTAYAGDSPDGWLPYVYQGVTYKTQLSTIALGYGSVTSVDASGGSTGFSFSGGPITTSGTLTMSGTLNVGYGGTGQTSYTDGQLLIGNSSGSTLTKATLTAGTGITVTNGAGTITIAATSTGTVTSVDASGGTTGLSFSGGPITTSGTLTLAGTLGVANGGTNITTYTKGDILYASDTSVLAKLSVGKDNDVLTLTAGVPAWTTPSSGGTVTSVDVSGGTTGLTFSGGPVTTTGTITMAGTLDVANGGTGASSASITAFNNITGYTASGATGTTSTNIVFSTSPTLTTPTLGVASATSINKVALTAPATGSTLTIADGKTLTASASITLAGTDGSALSLAANMTTSGASALTLTTTGATNVTLPTTGTVATLAGTETFTNKRVTPRVVTSGTTSGNQTPTGDTADQYQMLGLDGAITVLEPSGTPTAGQKLILRFKDDGTGRAITWTTSAGAFRAVGVTLPTTTVAGKALYVGCIYNATDDYYDAVSVALEA